MLLAETLLRLKFCRTFQRSVNVRDLSPVLRLKSSENPHRDGKPDAIEPLRQLPDSSSKSKPELKLESIEISHGAIAID